MAEQDSGRPPARAFFTVTDPEQARLLSNPESFRFFQPFVSQELSATVAAAEIDCALDTMLYRIKTFLKAGLLQISKLEKRAGRPIKHYRSVHDAYFIPFEVTPYAGLGERYRVMYRAREEELLPIVVKLLKALGQEGREVYRHTKTGDVWQNSAAQSGDVSDVLRLMLDPTETQTFLHDYRGPVGGDFSHRFYLTNQEAKEMLVAFHELCGRYSSKILPLLGTKRYYAAVTFLPLEP